MYSNPMRFAILGDLHYSDYPDSAHAAARDRLFRHFFHHVADLKADFVFAVGDTTHKGTLEELQGLQTIAQACNLPLICITGNHDTYSLPKVKIAPYFLGDVPSSSDSDLYRDFDVEDTRFILLDTAREQDGENYGGWVSQAQLDWLQNRIEDFDRAPHLRHLIVMGHHPLAGTTHRSNGEKLNIHNSEAVAQVFATLQSKLAFYFCGHNHAHSIYWNTFQQWYHVQTADPLDCKSFRLVHLDHTGVMVKTLDFDLSDSVLQQDFEITRHNIPIGFSPQVFEDSYGAHESDRNVTVKY